MKISPTSEPLVRLSCRIDTADVEAMLDTYDSGMCDISTANCISLVITRQLSCDRRIRLIRHSGTRAELDIQGHRIPLSAELVKWLVAAETGGRVDPIKFILHVPETSNAATAIVSKTKKKTIPEIHHS